MWAPTDPNAILTLEDVANAVIAINHLEGELEDAMSSPSNSQFRISELQCDLSKRRAWIAPYRRTPLEIMSLIFEYSSQQDWKSALRIAMVSKQWRALVLSTPRAWSYIDVTGERYGSIIETYIQRSSQSMLHIRLPDRQATVVAPLMVAERLHCLSCYRDFLNSNTIRYPKLECLILHTGATSAQISHLTVDLFPALRHFASGTLDAGSGISIPNSTLRSNLPPLQTLSVLMDRHLAWLVVLEGCRKTLVSLRLHQYRISIPPDRRRVVLPLLQCLEIHHWSGSGADWPLDLNTPRLKSYIERHEMLESAQIHGDVANVQKLRLDRNPILLLTPRLCILQLEDTWIDGGSLVRDVLAQLHSNPAMCPELEQIEVKSDSEEGSVALETDIEEANKGRNLHVRVSIRPKCETDLPGSLRQSMDTQQNAIMLAHAFLHRLHSTPSICPDLEWIEIKSKSSDANTELWDIVDSINKSTSRSIRVTTCLEFET